MSYHGYTWCQALPRNPCSLMKVCGDTDSFFTAIWNINLYLALRVEWLKARTRHDRWMEEVDLLTTELTCTAAFFDSRVNWWTSLIDKRSNISPELSDGLSAYAEHQADIQRRHASQVRSQHSAVQCVGSLPAVSSVCRSSC